MGRWYRVYLNIPSVFLRRHTHLFIIIRPTDFTQRCKFLLSVCPPAKNFSRLDTAASRSTTQGLFPESIGQGGQQDARGLEGVGSCLFPRGVHQGNRLFLSSPLIGQDNLRLRRWMLSPHRAFWAVQAVFEVDGMNSDSRSNSLLLIAFRVGDLFLNPFWRSLSVFGSTCPCWKMALKGGYKRQAGSTEEEGTFDSRCLHPHLGRMRVRWPAQAPATKRLPSVSASDVYG